MSEIMRIDTLKADKDLKWERISFNQSGEGSILKIMGQIGVINLDQVYQQGIHKNELQLLLFGGMNFEAAFTSEVFQMNISHSNDEEQQVVHIEVSQIQNKNLDKEDKIYYNQWLALENKRYCKEWFMVGREAGHFIKFPQSISQLKDIEIESIQELGYIYHSYW
eukprot:403373002